MGCVKSKRSASRADGEAARTRGDKAYLVRSEDASPRADPALLEYAQKLSEEIMARAVQQWAEVDRRYGDIPYIECDVP
ncbi:small membrane A-kinase anchor protein [Vanacampus margaritifer]